MKKLFFLLTTLFIFQSCTTENVESNEVNQLEIIDFYNKTAIENAEIETKLAYKNFHLKNIAKEMSKIFPIIFEEAQKNYRSNENLTVFSIEKVLQSIDTNDKTSLSDELQLSLDAFKNLEGKSWYPVFEFSNTSVLNQRAPYDEEKPIFVFEDEESSSATQEYVTGYQENSEGFLEPLDEDIDEEFVQERDLVIIAIDDDTHDPNHGDAIDNGPGGGSGGGSGNNNNTTGLLKINKMKVKQHKEAWHNGKSEIHIKAYKLSALPTNSGDCGEAVTSSDNCYSYDGRRILQWKRSHIGDEKTLNWSINSTFTGTGQSNDFVFYVIFEQDSWPANVRNALFSFPNGEYRIIKYRSWQSSYHHTMVHMNPSNPYGLPYAKNYSHNNAGISYNLL